MAGTITFVGAGPGAPDLITLRGVEALKRADLVIYAGSLVNEQLLDYAPPAARRVNSAGLDFTAVIAEIKAAYETGKAVVRLHTGDPAMYGAVAEQYRELDRLGLPYSVVPGVSSVFAAAAALKTEFTMPGLSQSAILTRDAGRTPVPDGEALEKLAACGCTLCIFLSVAGIRQLTQKLLAAGRSPQTPAAVVYRASWPNEIVVRGTVADIAGKVEAVQQALRARLPHRRSARRLPRALRAVRAERQRDLQGRRNRGGAGRRSEGVRAGKTRTPRPLRTPRNLPGGGLRRRLHRRMEEI